MWCYKKTRNNYFLIILNLSERVWQGWSNKDRHKLPDGRNYFSSSELYIILLWGMKSTYSMILQALEYNSQWLTLYGLKVKIHFSSHGFPVQTWQYCDCSTTLLPIVTDFNMSENQQNFFQATILFESFFHFTVANWYSLLMTQKVSFTVDIFEGRISHWS